MKLIISIRISIGRFLLKRKLIKLKRIKRLSNLKSAKTFGLVCVYESEYKFKIIEELIAKLRDNKIDVKALVFLPYSKLLEYIPQKLSIDFITPNDLDLAYHPIGQRANEFIDKQFDIFLDLNTSKNFTLEYVTAMSKAYYKVGVYEQNNLQVYDMMLKMTPNEDLKKIIDQSMYYLDMLNPA